MGRTPSTEELRDAIGRALQASVKQYNLAGVCESLGIKPDDTKAVLSKWRTVLNWLTHDPTEVLAIAERVLNRYPDPHLEELLWRIHDDQPEITELARRKIIDTLAELPDIWGKLDYIEVMGPVLPSCGIYDRSIEAWLSDPTLLTISTKRFRMFIERNVDPKVRDEASQTLYISALNPHLRRCGWELRPAGDDTGFPVYKVLLIQRGVEGRPKNIIFASSAKPDLRFVDAVNNDIEIVGNVHDVLFYDRPIPSTGLRWRHLQEWWAQRQGLAPDGEATAKSLYTRLLSSLPKNSPPQQLLFRTYFATFKDTFKDLPALLPEVWLHYDPVTVARRGREALLRQRMDFLLLFSHEVRVVLEVDGVHHYSENGLPSPDRYAAMVAGDRELRLSGYEVYRFGAKELGGPSSKDVVAAFFRDLFQRHGQ
ncbi:hypothetical protein [Polyangium sp. y55x31]|uniref:AbiJ-related protein n=1 Tax=Polyangium sp. y55x31 TaxID=3042688 RepID=UPI002482C6AA|nr:hypothetical protein [Polyangium sp. y55x31]MDI1484641.1 hypothetical protein [Polyangium sp. y55x31]